MAVPSTTINYPLTTISLSDASGSIATLSGGELTVPSIIPSIIVDSAVSAGTANQVLTSGPDGNSLVWAEPFCPATITPTSIEDVANATGAANQVLTAGVAGGSVVWADLPSAVTPSLADVMAVATAGDAGGQALSNFPSVAMTAGAGSAVTLAAVASNDHLSISTLPDTSGGAKDFSRSYLPMVIGGTLYYIPLFVVPV